MQDAFNLAWKLALLQRGQGQVEPLLQSYSIERSAVGDQVLANAERFTTLATLRSPVTQWLRNHIAPILGSFQFVQDKIKNDWFELSINYRHSPLSEEKKTRSITGLAAGDRMCDAPLTSLAGSLTTTLFEAIRDNRHTLLLLPASGSQEAISELVSISNSVTQKFPDIFLAHIILKTGAGHSHSQELNIPAWFDTEDRIHQKLHVTNKTLILVRPDGYLGYICQPADDEALIDYLGRYLIPQA